MLNLSANDRKVALHFSLLIALMLAALLTFLPHIHYPYPVHGDEWNHLAYTRAVTNSGNLDFTDPFTGEVALTLGSVDLMEAGYYVLWSVFQQITDFPWTPLFVYMPLLLFMITVMAVFVLANRAGFGLEAALITCVMPTSVGILGPAFMVPLAAGLLFIPLACFIAFYVKGLKCYILLFIIVSLLVFMHAPTAIGICIILIPYIVLNLKSNIWHSIGLIAALTIPFIAPFPWVAQTLLPTVKSLFVPQGLTPWVDLPPLLQRFGIVPFILSFMGILYLGIKGGKQNFGLILGLFLLVLVLAVYYRFHLGLAVVYERGLIYMQLLLSIIAGAGILLIRTVRITRINKGRLPRTVTFGGIMGLVAVIALLGSTIPVRAGYSYYHMIEADDYRSFQWVGEKVGDDYQLALLDPWKATAFTAVTGKQVCRHIKEYKTDIDTVVYRYLESGCRETEMLSDGGVSLVYNNAACNNPGLIHVYSNVYLTNPNLSWQPKKPEGILNTSFEGIRNNGPAQWVTYYEYCSPVFLYPEAGHEGGYCIGIDVAGIKPDGGYPAAEWFQAVSVNEGEFYRIGGWIKTEDIDGVDGAAIVCHWKGPGNISLDIEQFMLPVKGTTGWTYYEGVVSVPDGAVTGAVVCIAAHCTGTVWFDDLLFEKD